MAKAKPKPRVRKAGTAAKPPKAAKTSTSKDLWEVQQIINRLLIDGAFREQFAKDQDRALQSYDLTPAQMKAFKDIDLKTVDAFRDSIRRRLGGRLAAYGDFGWTPT